MSQSVKFTIDEIYSAFKETFSVNLLLEDTDITEASSKAWPYLEQLVNSPTMEQDISDWNGLHRSAFLLAYNNHYPFDSEKKSFHLMKKEVSFITSIAFYLYH